MAMMFLFYHLCTVLRLNESLQTVTTHQEVLLRGMGVSRKKERRGGRPKITRDTIHTLIFSC